MSVIVAILNNYDYVILDDDSWKSHSNSAYCLKITENENCDEIKDRFKIEILSSMTYIERNNWKIEAFEFFSYYGRAKVKLRFRDPIGYSFDFESGGHSISNMGINIVEELIGLIKKFDECTFFYSYLAFSEYKKIIENKEIAARKSPRKH